MNLNGRLPAVGRAGALADWRRLADPGQPLEIRRIILSFDPGIARVAHVNSDRLA